MGVTELQVFVSLVVILGAAFVALICDFLKGNNEQLRESNIELRVRQDECEKREEFLSKVQRHTIEALARTRTAPAPAATPAQPSREKTEEQPVRSPDADAAKLRAAYEKLQQERAERRRESRRHHPPAVTITAAEAEEIVDAAGTAPRGRSTEFAQSVVDLGETVTPADPPIAGLLPVLAWPVPAATPLVRPSHGLLTEQGTHSIALPAASFEPSHPALAEIDTPAALALPPAVTQARLLQSRVESLSSAADPLLPRSALALARPGGHTAEPLTAESDGQALPVHEAGQNETAPLSLPEMAPLLAEVAPSQPIERVKVVETQAVTAIGPVFDAGPSVSAASGVRLQSDRRPDAPALSMATAGTELAMPEPVKGPVGLPASTAAAAETTPESAALPACPLRPLTPPRAETRSKVVEMPISPAARAAGQDQRAGLEADIAGGMPQGAPLAGPVDEEGPFHGLAIVVGVVDHARLVAEHGPVASDQLMGSIHHLITGLAADQGSASHTGDDEFVLLFAGETGVAAKRRIQLVSERLWDFQLRSLGSFSVIFSWGASESTGDSALNTVRFAREQMLESQRNRRTLATGVGRFRRRAATS